MDNRRTKQIVTILQGVVKRQGSLSKRINESGNELSQEQIMVLLGGLSSDLYVLASTVGEYIEETLK